MKNEIFVIFSEYSHTNTNGYYINRVYYYDLKDARREIKTALTRPGNRMFEASTFLGLTGTAKLTPSGKYIESFEIVSK